MKVFWSNLLKIPSFRRAMLAAHPDRNPRNQRWAEERSREIIQAYELISEELRRSANGAPSHLDSNHSGNNSRVHTATGYRQTGRPAEGSQRPAGFANPGPSAVDFEEVQHYRSNFEKAGPEKYQVVVTAEARYAMPLRWMKSVVRFEEVIQKRGFHGAMVVYNNRMYPVFSVRGRSATARPGHALVLFEWPGGRAAMVMAHSVEHFFSLEMDYREIFWSRKSDGTVRMLRGGQTLLFPAFLLPVMESENKVSGQTGEDSGMPI